MINKSIQEAFDSAAAYVNDNTGSQLVTYRGLIDHAQAEDRLEWGLYVKDENANVLNWRMTDKITIPESHPNAVSISQTSQSSASEEALDAANSIAAKQNLDHNQKLLAAQRHLYTKAKKSSALQFWIAFVIAIIFPLLESFNIWGKDDDTGLWISLVSGIVSFAIVKMLTQNTKDNVQQASKIQEQFDTDVFGLRWNKTLVEDEVSYEVISRANRKFKGDRKRLIDWYTIPENIPQQFGILLSQRSNLTWDMEQRRVYAEWIKWTMIAFLIATIGIGIYFDPSLKDYLALMLPTLGLFSLGLSTREAQIKVYENQDLKEKEINNIIKEYQTNLLAISEDRLRSIQDAIYKNRKEVALVPNFVYNWRKHNAETDMKNAINNLIRRHQSKAQN